MKNNSINKISLIAKKIAKAKLNKQKVDSVDVSSLFNEEDASEIMGRLEEGEFIKRREKKIKNIEKTKNEDWENLLLKLHPTPKKNYLLYFSRIAAVLVLSLSVYYFDDKQPEQTIQSNDLTNEDFVFDEKDVLLKLDNGKVEVISADGSKTLVDSEGKVIGKQNGKQIDYKSVKKESVAKELAYNVLSVPYGKTFQIELSDGTKVHMNAGSTLKYPIQFIKGKKREVFLQGEAFFDVTKDPKHPFIVATDKLNIRVLGTSFNVSSYEEDAQVNTVLVEGAVCLYSKADAYNKETSVSLKPGRKASWKKGSEVIKIKKVDTSIYTDWRYGKIRFKHMQFRDILKKLERHYNVRITNTNEELANQSFTATFDIETIEQVLQSFDKNYKLTYVINGDRIQIK
ncbi:MAG: FecR domain-containing protein [Flavicella sp.]|nr:FecR domain-containing protein [Flavicella sp.]